MTYGTAAALMALVGVGYVAPMRAEAGCSHYAMPKAEREADAVLASLDILDDEAEAVGVAPSVPERRRPCSGPSCSEGRSQPGAPVPPAPTRGENGLCAAFLAGLTSPMRSPLGLREPRVYPLILSSTLERPSRPLLS